MRKRSERTKLRGRRPKLSSWFLRDLEEDKRQMEKDEHDKDNSSRELDDFIAAETSSNTVKKTEYEWKKFEGFC